jgi:two-component system chemotaxis response regulator CheB
MPRMDGHEATKQIMATTPTPIIVVTSVTRQEMVYRGLDILLAGALEIVQKPSALTVQNFETISEELIAKVRAVSRVKTLQAVG